MKDIMISAWIILSEAALLLSPQIGKNKNISKITKTVVLRNKEHLHMRTETTEQDKKKLKSIIGSWFSFSMSCHNRKKKKKQKKISYKN
jgi:hypothetical protein